MIDPGTGKPWTSCPINDASDVDDAVKSSQEAFQSYRKISVRKSWCKELASSQWNSF
jgi:succinate-semialdehyde dehydrogenase/glutarate-semialdehyde dehydrogenase